MHRTNWDNLRFVLSVAEHGSVSSAARVLGVNHATVLRRVAAFEDEHGGAVFEKTANGYVVLPDRTQVIEAAQEVENAIFSVQRLMHGARAPLRGVVRVSSTDSICQIVLPALVSQLNKMSPELQIDLMSSNSHLDFSRMQADVSVRPAATLPGEMIGDTAARCVFRAYCAPDGRDTWLGMTGPMARSAPAQWMAETIAPEDITGASDSFLVLREMAVRGMGNVVLPVFVGETMPGLVARPDLMPEIAIPIWVATYAELRDVPRIRIVRERILEYLRTNEALMMGGAPRG